MTEPRKTVVYLEDWLARASPAKPGREPAVQRQPALIREHPVYAVSSLKAAMSELSRPVFAADISLQLLRYATQVVNRGVLFARQGNMARAVGHFSIALETISANRAPRGVAIPLDRPSVLADAAASRQSCRGPLADLPWNRHLIQALGGGRPQEVIVVPMVLNNLAIFILFGDNLPHNRPIGSIEGLELLMLQAGLATEKLALEARLQRLDQRFKGAGPRGTSA